MAHKILNPVPLIEFNVIDIHECLPDNIVRPKITQEQLDQIGQEMRDTFWDRIGSGFWDAFSEELYHATKKVIDLEEEN